MTEKIIVSGASEHNLKNISVNIPHDKFTVVTGVSGSGKSSLVFDTIFKEAERRFGESFGIGLKRGYVEIPKSKVSNIKGLKPAIALSQKRFYGNIRATVGTLSEVYDVLRLLFAKAGTYICPKCGTPVKEISAEELVTLIMSKYQGQEITVAASIIDGHRGEYKKELSSLFKKGVRNVIIDGHLHILEDFLTSNVLDSKKTHVIDAVITTVKCDSTRVQDLTSSINKAISIGNGAFRIIPSSKDERYSLKKACYSCGEGLPEIGPRLFSFNSPYGACPECKGLGVVDQIDPKLVIGDISKSLREGVLVPTLPNGYIMYSQVTLDVLNQVCNAHGFNIDLPWKDLPEDHQKVILYGSDRIKVLFGKHPLENRLKWKGITAKPREEGFYKGIIPVMEEILKRSRNDSILRFVTSGPCPSCRGARIRPEALSVVIDDASIADISLKSIKDLLCWAKEFVKKIDSDKYLLQVGNEIVNRLTVLESLGLGYLTLDRSSIGLSAGEVQRIRLSSQIGAELRNILYIFDEPSVGLHAADSKKLINQLQKLKNLGNTVLVVEHDEDVIRSADHLIDIGPKAGIHGGEVLYEGPLPGIFDKKLAEKSSTAAWLTSESSKELPKREKKDSSQYKFIEVRGATLHNLKNINASFPLGCLTVVTGVSGAGKSSLVHGTLGELLKENEKKSAFQGHGSLVGAEHINKVVILDQSPIGRTSRSNAATYTKLFDIIRDLFSSQKEAKEQDLSKSHFSFNVEGGRCDTCEGSGVKEIGMHFLGSIEIPCETCHGKRFKDNVLSVRYREKTITDILNMTVEEALDFFYDLPLAKHILSTLKDIGLGYLPLGQSSTTLSGGEGQRIKIASEICKKSTGHSLYILDEPTTGLHFDDICDLLKIVRKLVDQGNTAIIVEHHLDVIKSADWIIDLGPESGASGGEVIAMGSIDDVCTDKNISKKSYTLQALLNKKHEEIHASKNHQPSSSKEIELIGVKTNNLKNIHVKIPLNKITVVTGLSGSGKSSLAFDSLYSESSSRFVQHVGSFMKRFIATGKSADIDSSKGLSGAAAISQGRVTKNPRSTVGTYSEILDYLRLLFSRAGHPSCSSSTALSFNHAEGACPVCHGLGMTLQISIDRLVTHPERSLLNGAMNGHKTGKFYGDPTGQYIATLQAAAKLHGFDFSKLWKDLNLKEQNLAMFGTGEQIYEIAWNYQRGDHVGQHQFKGPWKGFIGCINEEFDRKREDERAEDLLPLMEEHICSSCGGTRLNKWAGAVKFRDVSYAKILSMSSIELKKKFSFWKEDINTSDIEQAVLKEVFSEIMSRLESIEDVGLGYLEMSRSLNTLSTGEACRLEIAKRLSGDLTGVTYVLDEPTIGLHSHNTKHLIKTLKRLRDIGNTIVVVEHDFDVIREADYIIEIGPGSGQSGGTIVAEGSIQEIIANQHSITAKGLGDKKEKVSYASSRKDFSSFIKVKSAHKNNLKNVDVEFPMGAFIGVSGVSGSGKTSLVFDVLAESLSTRKPVGCQAIEHPSVADIEPIIIQSLEASETRSSIVATYSGIMDILRDLFSSQDDATAKGFKKSHFSFNHKDGQCEECKGLGSIKESYDLLGDVWQPCQSCLGERYQTKIKKILFNGLNIVDVLNLDISEAHQFFKNDHSRLKTILETLEQLGLDYLKLNQSFAEMSGGEIQRLQLATQYLDQTQTIKAKSNDKKHRVYLFDEPTRGLHSLDVDKLLKVLLGLRDQGATVIVVEHNVELLAKTDWIIDLGPLGGNEGGNIVSKGTPQQIALNINSLTGKALISL